MGIVAVVGAVFDALVGVPIEMLLFRVVILGLLAFAIASEWRSFDQRMSS